MTDQYTYPPPVAIYPGRGAMPPAPPTPPMPQLYPAPAPRKRKGGNIPALIGGATVAVLTAGVVGGLIGNHMAGTTAAPPPPAATPPTPTAEQVKASTIDLCTRFAAGYHAMPSPQNSAADVVPSLTYIMQALTDNPAADRSIRDAVEESVKLAREQASKLTNEPARGAIQPATTWTAAVANAADQKVWDLCRAYGS
ncbi:hypothetical protein LAUMK40_05760 [Mycobacterium kansasii]|uniref:hypothetical protein n=1 Tax=Mycobacterium kansasii TaxID=1768 RepID=UPI000F042E98|nr:hypothetical protein [Mycobacterium kansasii]VAZ69597.1 hypothetical protein LAUMK40_05760 [Mycobacterium kansasii]